MAKRSISAKDTGPLHKGSSEFNDSTGCKSFRADIIAMLCDAGDIDAGGKDSLLSLLEKTKEPFDLALTRLGYITEERLAAFLARASGAVLATDLDLYAPVDTPSDLNRDYFRNNRVLPAAVDGLTCALTPDPTNANAIDGLRFAINELACVHIVTATQYEKLAQRLLQGADCVDDAGLNSDSQISIVADAERLRDLASAEPAVRLVNNLISEASAMRASDIHLNPGVRSCEIRFRVDGVLRDVPAVSLPAALAAISRFKILSDLDIAERRRPQDGRMSFPVEGRLIDFRLSTTPTVYGESLAVRLLDRYAAPLDLDQLGFRAETVALLKRLIMKPNGIILLTGPTGSGKTTTLYSLLTLLVAERRNILTIEDPVEYRLDGVNQTQVNPAINLTFSNALRSFLRHDPDVIMVGEMRDLETARIAARAALTGHLVLSTLHTNDAPSAVTRLLDLGVEDYLVASTVLGIIGQRLVRRKCLECARRACADNPCKICGGAGFAGRTVISEALEIDDNVRSVIRAGAATSDITVAAMRSGFTSMQDDGAKKILAGMTSREEIQRAVGAYA